MPVTYEYDDRVFQFISTFFEEKQRSPTRIEVRLGLGLHPQSLRAAIGRLRRSRRLMREQLRPAPVPPAPKPKPRLVKPGRL